MIQFHGTFRLCIFLYLSQIINTDTIECYGDTHSYCETIRSSDCYEKEKECCKKCSELRRHDQSGCEYGDHSDECDENVCAEYRLDKLESCCYTCSKHIDFSTMEDFANRFKEIIPDVSINRVHETATEGVTRSISVIKTVDFPNTTSERSTVNSTGILSEIAENDNDTTSKLTSMGLTHRTSEITINGYTDRSSEITTKGNTYRTSQIITKGSTYRVSQIITKGFTDRTSELTTNGYTDRTSQIISIDDTDTTSETTTMGVIDTSNEISTTDHTDRTSEKTTQRYSEETSEMTTHNSTVRLSKQTEGYSDRVSKTSTEWYTEAPTEIDTDETTESNTTREVASLGQSTRKYGFAGPVGGGIAAVLLIALIIGIVIYINKKKRSKHSHSAATSNSNKSNGITSISMELTETGEEHVYDFINPNDVRSILPEDLTERPRYQGSSYMEPIIEETSKYDNRGYSQDDGDDIPNIDTHGLVLQKDNTDSQQYSTL